MPSTANDAPHDQRFTTTRDHGRGASHRIDPLGDPAGEGFGMRQRPVLPMLTGKTRITVRLDDDILEWYPASAPP